MSKSVVDLFLAAGFAVVEALAFAVMPGAGEVSAAGLAPLLTVSVIKGREPALKTVPFVMDWEITRPFV